MTLSLYRFCETHGMYEVQDVPADGGCPRCHVSNMPSKQSNKYGGKTIIIPPSMRSK